MAGRFIVRGGTIPYRVHDPRNIGAMSEIIRAGKVSTKVRHWGTTNAGWVLFFNITNRVIAYRRNIFEIRMVSGNTRIQDRYGDPQSSRASDNRSDYRGRVIGVKGPGLGSLDDRQGPIIGGTIVNVSRNDRRAGGPQGVITVIRLGILDRRILCHLMDGGLDVHSG